MPPTLQHTLLPLQLLAECYESEFQPAEFESPDSSRSQSLLHSLLGVKLPEEALRSSAEAEGNAGRCCCCCCCCLLIHTCHGSRSGGSENGGGCWGDACEES